MAPPGYLNVLRITGPIIIQPGTGWCALTGELTKDDHDLPSASLLGRSPELDAGIHWRTDQLSKVNLEGKVFTLAGGYWECRAKMPTGATVRPCFFLSSVNAFDPARTDLACEIDIFESYGNVIQTVGQHICTWDTANQTVSNASYQWSKWTSDTTTYRYYSVLIEPDYCSFAIDGTVEWKAPTPIGAIQPMMATVELALGKGWDADHVASPSALLIEELNVYGKPDLG